MIKKRNLSKWILMIFVVILVGGIIYRLGGNTENPLSAIGMTHRSTLIKAPINGREVENELLKSDFRFGRVYDYFSSLQLRPISYNPQHMDDDNPYRVKFLYDSSGMTFVDISWHYDSDLGKDIVHISSPWKGWNTYYLLEEDIDLEFIREHLIKILF